MICTQTRTIYILTYKLSFTSNLLREWNIQCHSKYVVLKREQLNTLVRSYAFQEHFKKAIRYHKTPLWSTSDFPVVSFLQESFKHSNKEC